MERDPILPEQAEAVDESASTAARVLPDDMRLA